MKIGIVVDNELNNDKRVLREASVLSSAGHDIYALCFSYNGKNIGDPKGIAVTRISISKKLKNTLFFFQNLIPAYSWLWSSAIKRFIKTNRIEVLHVHDLYMAHPAAMAIRKSGSKLPMVLDLHENYAFTVNTYNWTNTFLRRMLSRPWRWKEKEGEYLNYADRIVVLSENFRDELIAAYPSLKREIFCIMPNVPDIDEMNSYPVDISKTKFEKRSPLLLYFGIVAERRGIFRALDAFKKMVDKGTDIGFLVIGPVDKQDNPLFNSYLNDEKIKGRVIYIPWIDISELNTYLALSDICIAPFIKNPQHESGVANKIYDYMLGKKPLVVSDCKPQMELVKKHNCGLIYSNEDELIKAIERLLSNQELREQMGINGYNAVINDLNLGRVKNNLISLYNEIKTRIS